MLQWHFYKKWNTEALHSIVFDQNCIRFFLIKADSLFFLKITFKKVHCIEYIYFVVFFLTMLFLYN